MKSCFFVIPLLLQTPFKSEQRSQASLISSFLPSRLLARWQQHTLCLCSNDFHKSSKCSWGLIQFTLFCFGEMNWTLPQKCTSSTTLPNLVVHTVIIVILLYNNSILCTSWYFIYFEFSHPNIAYSIVFSWQKFNFSAENIVCWVFLKLNWIFVLENSKFFLKDLI